MKNLDTICQLFGWQYQTDKEGVTVFVIDAQGQGYILWKGVVNNIWEIVAKAFATTVILVQHGAAIALPSESAWLTNFLELELETTSPSNNTKLSAEDAVLEAYRLSDKGENYLGAVREEHANTANPPVGYDPQHNLVIFQGSVPRKIRRLNF